ncbi:Peptidyl-alpha-hydroxyglycine alpha-amidating lyase 1 [Eumeta japonica]|uniref:peptidylamidoglycolate lyase n=1 Tax=Eumeta variegata TaxID=151549 RepID=A0A4C2A0G0_EUMVA|nr:Peptidyl-alpha-hydroxyglycine alpha-amidating lyase 1 [Eumeta japonica]
MALLAAPCFWCMLQMFLLVLFAISVLCGTGFSEEGFYPENVYYPNQQDRYTKFKTAIEHLQNEPHWSNNWPDPSIQLGQVSGVAVDNAGRVYVFHRASNSWGANTFNDRNVYQAIGEPAIPHPTILIFNDTGNLIDMWGQNLFYIPHGITVDGAGNVWVTDVALHQVFKFTPQDHTQPALTLGEKCKEFKIANILARKAHIDLYALCLLAASLCAAAQCCASARRGWRCPRLLVLEQGLSDNENLPNDESSDIDLDIGIQHALEDSCESNSEGEESNSEENYCIIVSQPQVLPAEQ